MILFINIIAEGGGVVVKERSPLLPIAVEVQVFHAPRVEIRLELGFRA